MESRRQGIIVVFAEIVEQDIVVVKRQKIAVVALCE